MADTWSAIAIVLACLALASWLLAFLEMLGMWLFWPWVFSLGPRAFREPAVRANPTLLVGSRFETRSAKFYVVSPTECLFRYKSRFFDFSTPFPIKGRITLASQGASADGRIPLGACTFFLFFLLGWTIGTAAMLFVPEQTQNNSGINPILFGLFGFSFIGLMLGVSLRLERTRAREAVAEFIERHGAT